MLLPITVCSLSKEAYRLPKEAHSLPKEKCVTKEACNQPSKAYSLASSQKRTVMSQQRPKIEVTYNFVVDVDVR